MDNQLLLDAICLAAQDATDEQPFNDALVILTEFIEQNRDVEIAYARYLRELASDKVSSCPGHEKELVDCVERILKLNAKEDFDSYMLYMEWDRKPGKRFWRPRREVLFDLCMGFQDLEDDKIDYLIVSLPPRVGKSTTGCFALSWHMGRHPEQANLMSGHSDKLTNGFHGEVLSLVKSAEYRFHEIFPNSELVKYSLQEETIHLHTIRRFPALTCRAIGGTLTGAVEVSKQGWLYCDDLVSDREEAVSEERMEKLYAAYLNQLADRKLDGAKEVHVGTRWVPNDVIGNILEQREDDPRCRTIVIPALKDGKSNFTYSEGHGFSTEYYLDQRDRLVAAGEEDSWSAKFMGAPYYIGGLMFPKEDMRYYSELPSSAPDAIYAVCDTKDKGTDYAVQIVGYQYGQDHYIESVICDNRLPQVVEPRLSAQLCKHDVAIARYESNGAGGRIADDVLAACKDRGHVIKIEKRYSTENKETRILVDSGWVTERCLFKDPAPDVDYTKFLDMLFHYTTTGKNKHDDAPDAMSMYKRFVTSLSKATLEVFERPF